jgi:hypothetical protein
MQKRKQTEIVLNHIKKFGRINSLDAIGRYGITRISAVIYDLRKAGVMIKSEPSVTADGFVDYVLDLKAQRLHEANVIVDSVMNQLAFDLETIETDEELRQLCTTLTNAAVEANRVMNTR